MRPLDPHPAPGTTRPIEKGEVWLDHALL